MSVSGEDATLPEVIARKVIVTTHAVEQAQVRFRNKRIHRGNIRDDVIDAIASGREGVRLPAPIRFRMNPKRNRRAEDTRYVWTADLSRVYIVKRKRDTRNGHTPCVMVITSVLGLNGA